MDMTMIEKITGAKPVKAAKVSFRKKPKAAAPKKVQVPVEKVRIRAYSPEYYEWISPSVKVEPVVEFDKDKSVQPCSHPDCHNGWYIGGKYRRPCFRCGGKGTMTQADINRHQGHELARDMGVTKTTFKSQANPSWEYNLG